jgi:hypothetical protein
MKRLYLTSIAVVAFVAVATAALADPGTTWDKKINGQGRFKVLSQFGGAAVLDNETGRVWEQSPDTGTFTWFNALGHCYQLEVGGRKGWRLPTVEELASLVDTSRTNPSLPRSHPFSNVQSPPVLYWSATTFAVVDTSIALGVFFSIGGVGFSDKSDIGFAWCVRGGQGIDGVQQ